MASQIYDPTQLRIGRAIPLIGPHPIFRYLEMGVLSWRFLVRFPCFSRYHGAFLPYFILLNTFWNLWGEFIQSIRIIIDLPDVTEYLWAFCNFFGAVWPCHLWCRWITITRSPVKGCTQHVGKLMVGPWPMPRSNPFVVCWTYDLCTARCGAKLLHQIWLGWKRVNAHSYKFIKRQGFDIWVFVFPSISFAVNVWRFSCYQWNIMGGIQLVALRIFPSAYTFYTLSGRKR
jgi:hypothetical protein